MVTSLQFYCLAGEIILKIGRYFHKDRPMRETRIYSLLFFDSGRRAYRYRYFGDMNWQIFHQWNKSTRIRLPHVCIHSVDSLYVNGTYVSYCSSASA